MKQKQKQKKKSHKKKGESSENKIALILKIIAAVFFVGITAFYPLYVNTINAKGKFDLTMAYFNITSVKTFFFCVFTGIVTALIPVVLCVLFILTSRFYFRDYFIPNEPKRSIPIFEWALIAFIFFTFISTLLSQYQNIVWNGYPERCEGFWAYLCYALTFFIIARFCQPKRLHFLIFSVSVFFISLYGILQFTGHDIFGFFPFTHDTVIDAAGNPIYGGLSAFFKTTLSNINVVSAYCSIVVVLFAALFVGSRSKWSGFYLAASMISYSLLLIAYSDAGIVGVLGSMVLLIPFWLSDRARLGKILIVLSGWCAVYAVYNAYLTSMKSKYEIDPSLFLPGDQSFYGYLHPVTHC